MKLSYLSFLLHFFGYIMTQFNDQLLGGLPVPSVKVPQQSRRGQDSNPGKPEFFQAFFSDDYLCIYTCYSYGVQVTMYFCFNSK